MTPADKRVLELLDRWLTSIELHLKYADLDEPSYQRVQPWPVHERPARWMLELAQQKVLQLKSLCKTQIANNDPVFAESLELMGFLANLVGAQNINRFIPIADPAREQSIIPPAVTPQTDNDATQDAAIPVLKAAHQPADTTREIPQLKTSPPRAAPEVEHTREMPKLKVSARKPVATPQRSAADTHVKRAPTRTTSAKTNENPTTGSDRVQELVIADAVRLLKWGRQWHELAELIERMAERPAITEIRRILRTCKQKIEAQADP